MPCLTFLIIVNSKLSGNYFYKKERITKLFDMALILNKNVDN